MCTKVTSEMHISHGTTICYKVVRLPYRASFKDKLLHKLRLQKRYVTQFRREGIEIGKEYIGCPAVTKQLAEEIAYIGNSVGMGFIHSFKRKEDAIALAKNVYGCVAVIECIIPDETPYFEGLWEDTMICDCYASTNIKYVKRVY